MKAGIIEDVYPLSPLQEGMLFHHLYAPNSGVDIEQIICTLQEDLQVPVFNQAWQLVTDDHPILRSRFRWEGLDKPVQEVYDRVTLPIQQKDWRDYSEHEQHLSLQAYLNDDRSRDFDLTQAPLMRLALFRTGAADYRLVWSFQHVLLDGRSFPLVLKRVFNLYEALRQGRDIQLSPTRPYRDYINWLYAQDWSKAQEFWRAKLKGYTSPVLLKVAIATPPATQEGYGRQQSALSADLTNTLRSQAERHKVTLNTFMQGAWALLLSRYSGQADVVFGATRACRRSALDGAEDMVGLLINTLPVRVQTFSETQLLPWLQALRAQQIEVRQYEHTPLARVQGWSDLPPGTPLFESLLVFENYQLNALLRAQGGDWLHREFHYIGQTNFPLTVLCYAEQELLIQIEYDRSCFEDAAITRMLGHLETLLDGMAADPYRQLSDYPLLTPAELRQLLFEWNAVRTDYSRNICLHELFEARAATLPDQTAVVFEGEALSYGELNRRANRLANYLHTLGVGPEIRVGLYLERSLEMLIGLLAILKAGGAYVPLDPSYPAERINFMLEDAQVPVLIAERRLLDGLNAGRAKLLCLDTDGDEIEQCQDHNPQCAANANNAAYIIYTSGSTGTPKGVIITHANVTRLMAATQPWFNFDHTDVWTLFHSYAFDFSVWEIWGALLYGGRLVIVPYDVSRDPNAFYALLHQERVTVLNQTPSAFRQLSHAEERIGQKSLALRYIIFGGEALELQSLKPWVERHGDQSPRLINMYGITETTVHVTYRPISTDDIMANAGSVIGQAISDLQVLILDAQRQPTPIGVAGELHIGGAGLARAYLNRPELTAEKFITDPFSENPQARLYKTGDLARYLSDGDIEYLGRLDNQVKLRGFRIELGEIEVVLKQHPRVRDSVVMLREFASGDHRLVAYVVGKQSLAPSHDELRSYLDGKLPDYMVPAAFVWLATLPVTSNGKVDRKALPMPDIARPELASNFVAPRNPVEQSLAQIWSQVLAIDRVGMHDNFFALGGDSILGIHVLAKARQAGLQIDLKQLFQYPTIAGLAAASTRALTIDDEQGLVEGSAPLTPIQHWFFEQNLAALHHWNQAFLFTAPHATDIHALEQALQHLLWHHDALRLRFSSTEHGWQQQLHTGDTVPFTRVDLSALSKQEQASAIEAAAAEQQASLDLARGPLLRAAYFDLGVDQPGRLLIVIHHLVVDGVSWRILMEDLESAYTQLRHNKPVQLPAKTSSFNRWSQRLADYAASDALQNEREYWLAVPGVEDAFLPVDYPARELNTEAFAKTISVVLGAAETEALLHKIPGVYHTQINDALLTALAQAFEKWTNSRRHLLVDLEGHGREELFSDVDLSRTVGWFTTVFPVRLDPGAAIHPGEVLKSIKEQLRSIPQRGIGYGLLRYLSGDPELVRKLRSLPQPEVLFNYLGQFDQVLSGSSLFRFAPEPCGPKHSPQGQRRHLLEIVGQVTDGQLQMNWTYSEKVHRAETIERLAQDFMEALQGLISHCQSVGAGGYTPSDFPLTGLDQAALDQFLTTCTGTGEPDGCKNIEDIYPLSPMQQLFYSINAAQPEVAFEQWHYTLHGKLDAAAFQEAWRQVLARHTVLRTAFFAEGLNAPLQVVYRDVALPWAQHDWRDLPATEQGKQLALFLEADRARGFDLTQVPLLRVTLIRVAEDVYHFLWSTHHLLVDGWSWPLIFKELSACYEALSQDRTASLEPSLPYRDYIAWLARQPVSQAESFWRRILQGCQAPTPLPASVAKSSGAMERFIDQHITLSLESTAALQDFARGHQLTLNTIVQGGWALLLSHYSGTTDVLFGATFSGRPTDLPGVESMVGPCINNLPVRVHVSPETSLVPWLMQLQELQFDYDHYQHTPLVQIQGWSDIPWRFRLFDSLIVFLNYQVDESARRLGHHVTIRHVASPEKTNYPLTLSVMPGQALSLKLIYASTRFESELIQDLLTTLQTLLHGMLADPLAPLTKLLLALPPPPDAAPASVTVTPRQYQAPQTELQQVIAAVWQQAFGVTQVSLQDNFFDLGGHSLLMVRVHSQLQEMLNIQLPIVKMFQYPTISALAGYLHQDLEEQPSYNAVYARAQKQKQAQARHPRHGKILRKP